MKLGSLNNEVGLEVLKLPKSNSHEGNYVCLQRWSIYDEHKLVLFYMATLNAWDREENKTKGELRHLLKLYRVKKNPILIFHKH